MQRPLDQHGRDVVDMRITPSMDDLLTEWKQFDVNPAGQTAPANIPLAVHGSQCHYPGQMGVSYPYSSNNLSYFSYPPPVSQQQQQTHSHSVSYDNPFQRPGEYRPEEFDPQYSRSINTSDCSEGLHRLLAERPNFPAAQRGGRADSSSSRAYGLEQRDDGATTDSRSSEHRGPNKGGAQSISNADAEDELDAKEGGDEDGKDDDKRARRMLSNRESARRSRQRKQQHLEELQAQVSQLQAANGSIVQRINMVSQLTDGVADENRRLRGEVAALTARLSGAPAVGGYFPAHIEHLQAQHTH